MTLEDRMAGEMGRPLREFGLRRTPSDTRPIDVWTALAAARDMGDWPVVVIATRAMEALLNKGDPSDADMRTLRRATRRYFR